MIVLWKTYFFIDKFSSIVILLVWSIQQIPLKLKLVIIQKHFQHEGSDLLLKMPGIPYTISRNPPKIAFVIPDTCNNSGIARNAFTKVTYPPNNRIDWMLLKHASLNAVVTGVWITCYCLGSMAFLFYMVFF